jgi:hypothetical protein
MAEETRITLVAAILAFAAGILSTAASLYSARFRRYAMQRWWERKADAYTRIADALSEMVEYYRMTYAVELEGHHISEEGKAEFGKRWRKGWEEARRATNIGAFLISDEANAALNDLWTSFDHASEDPNWFNVIEVEFTSAEKCLRSLVAAAKKDLKVADG